jgi:hypothetical protein
MFSRHVGVVLGADTTWIPAQAAFMARGELLAATARLDFGARAGLRFAVY